MNYKLLKMKYYIIFIGFIFIIAIIILSSFINIQQCTTKINLKNYKESDYQKEFAKWIDGTTEFLLDDGSRVDILTKIYAIEIDYAHKWAEGVGQALFYSLKTKRIPGLVLILAKRKSYQKYIERVFIIVQEYNITIWTIDENLNIKEI